MGTEKKEVLPKEEISEESKPHGSVFEKLSQEVYQGHGFGAASEKDVLKGHLRESPQERDCVRVNYLQDIILM